MMNLHHYAMDERRCIDPAKIPDRGLLIGRIDRFALIIEKDQTYHIEDSAGGILIHLSHLDLEEIKTLLELANDWHAAHKFTIK